MRYGDKHSKETLKMKLRNEFPSDGALCKVCLFTGTVGALIQYGVNGTLQAACLGLGVGAVIPIALLLLLVMVT